MRTEAAFFCCDCGSPQGNFPLKVKAVSVSVRSFLGGFPLVHGLLSLQIRLWALSLTDKSGQISLPVCV